jgi:tyrosyl-tRNA synthetase
LENRLPAFVMLVPLLPGIDSQAKMSAFSQNEILITANRTEIRERLLQIQNLGDIVTYMRMLTDLDEQHISQLHVAFSDGSLPIDQLSTTMADAVLAKLNPKLEHLG